MVPLDIIPHKIYPLVFFFITSTKLKSTDCNCKKIFLIWRAMKPDPDRFVLFQWNMSRNPKMTTRYVTQKFNRNTNTRQQSLYKHFLFGIPDSVSVNLLTAVYLCKPGLTIMNEISFITHTIIHETIVHYMLMVPQ